MITHQSIHFLRHMIEDLAQKLCKSCAVIIMSEKWWCPLIKIRWMINHLCPFRWKLNQNWLQENILAQLLICLCPTDAQNWIATHKTWRPTKECQSKLGRGPLNLAPSQLIHGRIWQHLIPLLVLVSLGCRANQMEECAFVSTVGSSTNKTVHAFFGEQLLSLSWHY